MDHIVNISLSDDDSAVIILDQSRLPTVSEFLTLRSADDMFEAIAQLRVRGAPAIGIFAAYALYVLARCGESDSYDEFCVEVERNARYLDSARPTAVNLSRQLKRMLNCIRKREVETVAEAVALMKREAIAIHKEDIEMCQKISEYGLTLIKDGYGILTHCNAGPLATSRYGTGLGSILLGRERGMGFRVYCDETRPLLQGARLTAYELIQGGVDCTLICDNMASIVMSEGKIDACFVGCDRVARNGDTANKIGTSGVAVLARHYGIPFYVFCPTSTIDMSCETGDDIEIEEREPEEIYKKYFKEPMAPEGVKCYNPAFDVTPAELITAIITEKGILRAPYTESLGGIEEL